VRGLGYEIEPRGRHNVLRAAEGRAQAVAVFLEEDEQPDQTSSRFENQTPATYALAHADRDRLPWVVAVRGGTIRLYSTSTSGAAGQRGRTETFVELNLPLLPSAQAGYLDLLFSAESLAEGKIGEIRQASSIYASDLSERLRERVYKQVVPRLSTGVHPESVMLTVENTGEMLTPQLVSTLAEPFRRGTERIRTDHAGVGLGLAIVKSITQAHDGTLTITPRAAGGLCVTVQLPLEGGQKAAHDRAADGRYLRATARGG
jgi:hypothetical protein